VSLNVEKKVLISDIDFSSTSEYVKKVYNSGMLIGCSYRTKKKDFPMHHGNHIDNYQVNIFKAIS
jgi:hypothetical protein